MKKDNLAKHYQNLLKLHGDSFLAAQYSSSETQDNRLRILTQIASLHSRRVLDFGCGTGRLGELLREIAPSCDYNGVDIVQDFHDICNLKFPAGKFDFLKNFQGEIFDYIFISGVFNNKLADNRQFYRETIKSLFEITRHGLAFNMMSTYVDFQDENLFYESPEAVFSFIKNNISPFVTIRHDYLIKRDSIPFDFTVYVYKEAT